MSLVPGAVIDHLHDFDKDSALHAALLDETRARWPSQNMLIGEESKDCRQGWVLISIMTTMYHLRRLPVIRERALLIKKDDFRGLLKL
jgi:hypothetical protein